MVGLCPGWIRLTKRFSTNTLEADQAVGRARAGTEIGSEYIGERLGEDTDKALKLNLSPHFRREEFERSGPMPDAVVPAYERLCQELLEPVRERFKRVMRITSGYRSAGRNTAIGGAQNSQHVARWNPENPKQQYCAADFQIPGVSLATIFNWIRLESGLRFDQVILEYGQTAETETDDCIHLSWSARPRRMARIGATRNRSPYVTVEVGPPGSEKETGNES